MSRATWTSDLESLMNAQFPEHDDTPGLWTADDVGHLYKLVLNRDGESRDILEEMAGWDLRRLVGSFFHSAEFSSTVGVRLQAGERPREAALPADLAEWAARMMPLSEEGRRTVLASRSWSGLYHALAADPAFRGYMDDDSPLTERRAFQVLTAASQVEGQLEEASAYKVRGWATFPADPDSSVALEVWVNGVFCCAGMTHAFRRDVQDRFGGAGLSGFEIEIPAAVRRRFDRMDIELRAASNGFTLGRATVEPEASQPDLISDIRSEIAHARRVLEGLERRLPWVESSLSTPLSEYAAYSRVWCDAGPPPAHCDLAIDIIMDIADGGTRDIEDAAHAIASQSHEQCNLILVAAPSQSNLAADLRQRIEWAGHPAPSVLVVAVDHPVARIEAALDTAVGDVVLALTSDVVLQPHAVGRIAARFASEGPALEAVYFDEDVLDAADADGAPRNRRRTQPRLKPDFDTDYLLQTPYVGEAVAFRRSALQQLGLRREAKPHAVCDALLRARPEAVGHISRVLAGRIAPEAENLDVWRDCVSHHLAQVGIDAAAQPRADILGAPTRALRVRRNPPPASACVIIPTRDGLDLLRPCIDSLLERRADNVTPFEILIIDHDSRELGTRDYLAQLQTQKAARILPYSGDFNWALMNNLAAAQTQAQVLVFLNNDTVALSREWLDELTAQAMRPEIGVVGCRLIYGDGTMQHAGFVNREETYAFLSHEGVGAPGCEPGYLDRHVVAHATAAVTGACMAVRADLFRDLGGFDPGLPVEGSDVDLCLRARARGLTVLYTPDATLYHLESKTRGFNHDPVRQAVAEAASRLIWRRWGERFARDPGFNPHFDRMSRPFARLRPPPPWSG